MSADPSSDDRDPVERLAEEFVARHRRGERPSPAEYAEHYPQWADRIQALFPALLLMEHHKPGVSHPSYSAEDGDGPAAPLEQLGDYRIIREVGRGGMAIVYEAEQESLGRHVALKVLLGHSRLDPRQATRFQCEARAAARLHHTNIVPVYGVGAHDGVHYYAMQFIPGQALDEVLHEVRRLRQQSAAAGLEAANHREGHGDRSIEAPATDVARGLLSGRFAAIEPGSGISGRVSSPDGLPAGETASPDAATLRAERWAADAAEATAERQGSSILAPGQGESSSLSGPLRHYWRGIARIGMQVAEALQYAHAQGILHRDIKPSNLLLDLHGTAWVADFGLAKVADQADLTHTGDVVGTWRYLAPERFRGVSDPRSDVYSLGLTLYELLVLRPAFDGATREELLRQVSFGVPPRPRAVNPDVPRDLETIVLKAIERDPAGRYQTAGELADDLRRFIEDRPTLARRCSPLERAWRWARRNPAVATLGASVVLLLAVLATGSILAAVWLNAERNRTLEHLWGAYVDRAHAGRSGRQVGQRFRSLDVLTAAAKIRITGDLRNEAIACLALVDVRPVRHFVTLAHEDDGFAVDQALERYAIGDSEGNVSVRRLANGEEVVRLPRGAGPTRALVFSPDGRYLSAGHAVGREWLFDLWDIEAGAAPRKVLERLNQPIYFSADGHRIATRLSATAIGFYDPATGALWKSLPVAPALAVNGFHPDSRRFLLTDPSCRTLRLIDIERGEEVWSHAFEAEPGGVAWRADERLCAFGGTDHRIYVWDVANNRLQSVLEGHQNSVVGLRFTHAGNLLVSSSWDGTMRVWDPVRGSLLLTMPANLYEIGPDDRQVVIRQDGNHFGVWQLADGRECRTLHHGMVGNRTPRPDHWGPHGLDFSPDGRLLASSDVDGIRFWDPPTGAPVGHLPLSIAGAAAQFSPDGSHLMTRCESADPALRIWALRAIGDGPDTALRIGPPRIPDVMKGLYAIHFAWDGTGRYVTVNDAAALHAVILNWAGSAEVARLGPHPGLNQCPISPDGRWVATATWKGKDVKVWDVATGRLVWEMPCDSAMVRFSPDGRWLAVAQFPGLECRLLHVGSWRPGPVIRVGASFLAMVFSRNGRLLAIEDAGRVRVVDPDSGREVATLDTGTGSPSHFFCLAVSPDGTRVAAGRDHIIHLWDLRRIREQLATRGLDWAASPYPPPAEHPPLRSIVLVQPTDNPIETEPIARAPAEPSPAATGPKAP